MQLSDDWRPSATLETLKQRAALLRAVREFFAQREVLEVDTPLLSRFGVTDLHLENLSTALHAFPSQCFYLQTSPEYAMKRIVAAYQTSIYQLSKVFRDDEVGRHHNPEFTMLEWYRVGYSMSELVDEVVALLHDALGKLPVAQLSYQEAFLQTLKLDPLAATVTDIKTCLSSYDHVRQLVQRENDRDTLLQLAMSVIVEPSFCPHSITVVSDFPASQAALAQLSQDDDRVAKRFEVYVGGIELANGYQELTDAAEQQQRFDEDNALRALHQKPRCAADHRLIDALASDFPTCAGVALGFDRLLMLQSQKHDISQVLPFSISCA